MKKKNPYATTNGKPIKAPKNATSNDPKSRIVTANIDMRAKVNK